MSPRDPVPYAKDSQTSLEAAFSVDGKPLTEMEEKVMAAFRKHGPLTTDEVEFHTGMRHQSASARVNGLTTKGVLVVTKERRKTRSGRSAFVYRIATDEDSRAEPKKAALNATPARKLSGVK